MLGGLCRHFGTGKKTEHVRKRRILVRMATEKRIQYEIVYVLRGKYNESNVSRRIHFKSVCELARLLR
jgi:hypothetical protein